jgi:quinoprotein glucose dehydrogenase
MRESGRWLVLAALVIPGPRLTGASANADWSTYLGDKERTHYSPLQQINRTNVAKLKVAWTYDTGDKGEYQANNLIVSGVLYTASPTRKVIALDATSGRELWKWDPRSERPGTIGGRQRGLVFWQNETGGEQRLFTGAGNHLYALDPKSGEVIRSFGENGSIHLGSGLDGTPNIGLNTPGVTYRDLLIIGGVGGPGAVRAFDVRTGAFGPGNNANGVAAHSPTLRQRRYVGLRIKRIEQPQRGCGRLCVSGNRHNRVAVGNVC